MATTVVEDFEAYALGTNIAFDIPEWGDRGYLEPVETRMEGTKGAGLVGSQATVGYNGIFSNADGSAPGQTATFGSYPSAGSVIRLANYQTGTGDYIDMAWGIPDGTGDFNSECYRIRGGPGEAPFIRKTVGGNSTALATSKGTTTPGEFYEFACSYVDTGSAVDFELYVWEWDRSAESWQVFDSITATDTNRAHVGDNGVGMAVNRTGGEDSVLDFYRFNTDVSTVSNPPSWTPDIADYRGFSSIDNGVIKSLSNPWILDR